MKLVIASDIHGSAYYCQFLVDAFKDEKADKLIILGDILYHGPRNDLPKDYSPKKVIEMLNPIARDIICVRGNCDSEVDQMVLDFPLTADYSQLLVEDRVFFLTHGHKFNVKTPPVLKENDVLIYGHFHIPAAEKFDDFIAVSPGSVAIPKESSPNAYILFDDGTFYFKNIENGEIFDTYKL